jgi:hypothetical protein
MVATFLTILAAIGVATEMSRIVQAGFGGPSPPTLWWSKLPMTFVLVFLFVWVVGAIGYGVLFALRWTGVHRLSNIVTWPQPRQ